MSNLLFKRVSSRWALAIPILLFLLALLPGPYGLPGPRNFFMWMDGKIFDGLFVLSGFPVPEHPIMVIAKDQPTIDLLGREVERRDMALVLRRLASLGVKVAGLDFVYSEKREADQQAALIEALNEFPHAVLAERFKPRTALSGTLQTITVRAEEGDRPVGMQSLDETVAISAVDRGVINVFTDADNVIRVMPLAFSPSDSNEFHPSLAMSAWAQSLCAEATLPAIWPAIPETPLLREPVASVSGPPSPDFASAAHLLLLEMIKLGPNRVSHLGHAGLDDLLRRRELLWLAESAVRKGQERNPEKRTAWLEAARTFPLEKLPGVSWLRWPEKPFPVMGAEFAPTVRLPFSKLSPPLQGDGIPEISMARFLQSDFLRGNDRLEIEAGGTPDLQSPVNLAFDTCPPGAGNLSVSCRDYNGNPVASVSGLVWQTEGACWATGSSGIDGWLRFENLAPGSYAIELVQLKKHGKQTLTTENPVFVGSGGLDLPLATFLPQDQSLDVSCAPASGPRELILSGDGLWMARTGTNGELPGYRPLSGFSLNTLDGEAAVFDATASRVLNASGTPLATTKIAVLDETGFWKNRFRASVKVEAGAASCTIDGICPGLGLGLAMAFSAGEEQKPKVVDIDLCLGEKTVVASSPEPFPAFFGDGTLAWRTDADVPAGATIWFRTSKGDWITAEAVSRQRVILPRGATRIFVSGPNVRGKFNQLKSLLKGKAVFLGTSLLEDQDFYSTPIHFIDPLFKHVPGVHLHAQLYSSLKRGDFLTTTFLHPDRAEWKWSLYVLLFMLPLLVAADEGFRRLGGVAGGLLTIGLALGWWWTVRVLFFQKVLTPCGLPMMGFFLFGLFRGYQSYVEEREREKHARSTFGRFVSAQMVDEILKNPNAIKPGGEKKALTVMFTDLAGFTSISEALTPEALVALMNEYLGAMTATLFEYGGTLDKYIGDAVMGFWNHPALQDNHPERACRCALAMQKRLAVLREKWKKQGYPSVSMRAGVNTAECVVGFMGGDQQMNFTCMGDGVNLASRMEGANKEYHTLMMISESTLGGIKGTDIRTRFLDFLAVKGKAIPIKVFELIGVKGDDDALWDKVLPLYEQGIALYLRQDWDGAEKAFQTILAINPDDGPAQTYLHRCHGFRENPPGKDWDGRYILKTK